LRIEVAASPDSAAVRKRETFAMNETHATLDRLEKRIEDQAARIDALYRMLELRGILPCGVDAARGDAMFDEELDALDLPSWHETPRPTPRFRVGEATGV
jgi:hypothetical protein